MHHHCHQIRRIQFKSLFRFGFPDHRHHYSKSGLRRLQRAPLSVSGRSWPSGFCLLLLCILESLHQIIFFSLSLVFCQSSLNNPVPSFRQLIEQTQPPRMLTVALGPPQYRHHHQPLNHLDHDGMFRHPNAVPQKTTTAIDVNKIAHTGMTFQSLSSSESFLCFRLSTRLSVKAMEWLLQRGKKPDSQKKSGKHYIFAYRLTEADSEIEERR